MYRLSIRRFHSLFLPGEAGKTYRHVESSFFTEGLEKFWPFRVHSVDGKPCAIRFIAEESTVFASIGEI